jgi:predicted metal-dependent phosphoesterase TrpH
MLRVDFHTHTIYSPDSLTTPEKLIESCRRKGVDRVVITDHNTIEGALRAKEIDPELVIVGEEIMTTEGELLAAYVKEEIPRGLHPQEAINHLEEQDAFISVSHPFDFLRGGDWKIEELLEILPRVDAIETFNARCVWPGFNWQAQKLAKEYGLRGTHGSDAHTAFEVGRGSLLLPEFDDATSLRAAMQHAISAPLRLSSFWVRFTSRYAVFVKRRQNKLL